MPIFRKTFAAIIAAAAVGFAACARGETDTAEPDAFLEYIEATGSQYIDTGVNAETGLKAQIDFAWASGFDEKSDWSLLDAADPVTTSSDNRSRIFLCHMYNQKPFFGYGKTRGNPTNSVPFVGGQRCEIITDMSSTNDLELTQNGVNTFDATDRETFATNGNVNLHLNLFVFATNYGGAPSWYGKGKLYELKIFRKNATTDEFDLLRHYIPCIRDNRAGLYDKVNGTISFSADSSANFIAGTVTNAVSQPIKVTLFDEHPEWGYKVEGLGSGHDEMALVFTNQNASSMAWTVPADLTDVQFLVVGGGGGGGADYNPNSGSAPFLGGSGGGGGGVVTGIVSTVVSNTEFAIKVGAGGAGGQCNKTQVNGGFGASYAGSDSTVSLGGVAVLTAFGGGNDKGTTSSSAKSGRVGGTGGSNAGSRGGYGTAQGEPTRGSVAVSFASQLAGYGVLGNVGGSGNTGEQYWGYYSASGGGGGATTPGGTPTDYSTGGTGGEGLASDITGTLRVYGSGGGGTISGNLGGAGGTGAGSGNIDTGGGQDALANQGGGGGGGGRSGNGGKGGSGIVVLRFRVPGVATGYNDPQGNEIQDSGVVEWLSNNGFTQDDIDALGNDSDATDKLYECYLLNCSITAANRGGALSITGFAVSNDQISVTIQLERHSPLGAINGELHLYGASDLASDFGPIAETCLAFGDDDSTFGTDEVLGPLTQSVTATFGTYDVRETFFKAAIEFRIPEDPE